ncbi:MAG TPA: MFS transporter, partial [Gaiellaceae bacterium]|nr:MFS transporter [Gaiellaceae bacterium]
MRRLRRPTGSLWSHPDFLKLWTGQSISELGSQVSQLAIPWLAAVGLHASPIEFSLLAVLGFLPFILFALPAGVWVDRLRRRQILIVGDASRAVLLALVPILWAAGVLQIWHLLVLQFVIGIFTVFFDVAYQWYLPALVEREHLVDGNSKLQLTVSIAQVAGPSMSGGLIAAVTAPYAIVADAASFVVSTVFMLHMRHREELPERDVGVPHPRMWPQVKEGLQWVLGNRHLRSIAGCTGTSNFFNTMLFSIFVLYAVRVLHLSSVEVGAVFAVGSAGSIGGALAANRLQQRIGVGPAIVLCAMLFSVGGLAFPLAPRA